MPILLCRLQELRRGADPARIFSIAFARGDAPEWLAMSSDKGTVHVFKLATSAEAKAAAARQLAAPEGGHANPVSSLKFVSVRRILSRLAKGKLARREIFLPAYGLRRLLESGVWVWVSKLQY